MLLLSLLPRVPHTRSACFRDLCIMMPRCSLPFTRGCSAFVVRLCFGDGRAGTRMPSHPAQQA